MNINVKMSYREDGTTLATGNPNVVQALRILSLLLYGCNSFGILKSAYLLSEDNMYKLI